MKYLVLIPDGAADWPEEALGGRTPLQAARTPNLDRLVCEGETGLARTVPEGMEPGSDVANLSLFGYDPRTFYTGRAPLEAASLGIPLGAEDVAFRCNLVSTGGRPPSDEAAVMEDYSAGHIDTAESRRIIDDFTVSEHYRLHCRPDIDLYPGVSYRHLLVWRGGSEGARLTPPHNIIGEKIGPHLPKGEGGERLRRIMEASALFLRDHIVNRSRRDESRATVDCFWLWGAGRRPALSTLRDLTGLSGAVISAVDLVNGIGALAGMERIVVPGATGYIDTDYAAKATYALEALNRYDIVFVHIEAPDEAGHQGDVNLKVQTIEAVDSEFLARVLSETGQRDVRFLVAPDHPTPVRLRTHTSDPIPFVISPAPAGKGARGKSFDEQTAAGSGLVIENGHSLLGRLLGTS